MSEQLDLSQTVRERQIIVCCGAGGVGKTTSAAALGLLAAQEGKDVVVMTIDPAKRLAQAMGLDTLDNEPREVEQSGRGRLSAMMLDTKRTFDTMVETYAPSDRVRETIFANNYYQQLSKTLGGSKELIAMERVLEIGTADRYDLLIVDTPPAQHALDFLDAPQRLIDLLDGSFTQALLASYGVAARAQFNFFKQSSAMTLKFLERLTGIELMADLSDFLLAFSSMFDGVKERSRRVMSLMSQPTTAFLLICAPEPVSLGQVRQFADRLADGDMTVSGVLVNRVHLPVVGNTPSAEDLAALNALSTVEVGGRALADRVMDAFAEAEKLARVDAEALREIDELPLRRRLVPHLNRDVHSMADLAAFAAQMA